MRMNRMRKSDSHNNNNDDDNNDDDKEDNEITRTTRTQLRMRTQQSKRGKG